MHWHRMRATVIRRKGKFMSVPAETASQRAKRLLSQLGTNWAPDPEQWNMMVLACQLNMEDYEVQFIFFELIQNHYSQRRDDCVRDLAGSETRSPESELMIQILCGTRWPRWVIHTTFRKWCRWLRIRTELIAALSGRSIDWHAAFNAFVQGATVEAIKAAASPRRPRP